MVNIRQIYKESIPDLINTYDSANSLFKPDQCAPGNKEIFEDLINNNNMYMLYEDNIPLAFASYHEFDTHIANTGLYVRRDAQKKGFGKILLNFMEDKEFYEKNIFKLEVLHIATWAINFYEKNGYVVLSEDKIKELNLEGIILNNWSKTMYKIVDRQKRCRCGE